MYETVPLEQYEDDSEADNKTGVVSHKRGTESREESVEEVHAKQARYVYQFFFSSSVILRHHLVYF